MLLSGLLCLRSLCSLPWFALFAMALNISVLFYHALCLYFQVENLLFSTKGVIKLCDFGSATIKALYPNDTWTAMQRSLAEDEVRANGLSLYS